MTDGDVIPEGFLKAIAADPADDGIRLIAADWCEENGYDLRAEFIRAGIAFAKLREPAELTVGGLHMDWPEPQRTRAVCESCRKADGCCEYHRLQWRLSVELLGMATAPDGFLPETPAWIEHTEWWRGFPRMMRMMEKDWVANGPWLVQAHPLERIQISDRRPERTPFGDWRWYPRFRADDTAPWYVDHRILAAAQSMNADVLRWRYHHECLALDGLNGLNDGAMSWARSAAGWKRTAAVSSKS